jgi:hypothetical protein
MKEINALQVVTLMCMVSLCKVLLTARGTLMTNLNLKHSSVTIFNQKLKDTPLNGHQRVLSEYYNL